MMHPELPPKFPEKFHALRICRRQYLANVNSTQAAISVHKPSDVGHAIPCKRLGREIGRVLLDHKPTQAKSHIRVAGSVPG